jgi:hypothetical protein
MAEIEKALPNEVRKEINIPSEEDIQVELQEEQDQLTKEPVEVQENEDGSVDVNFRSICCKRSRNRRTLF